MGGVLAATGSPFDQANGEMLQVHGVWSPLEELQGSGQVRTVLEMRWKRTRCSGLHEATQVHAVQAGGRQ